MTEHAIARIATTAKRFLLLFFSLRIRTVSFLLGRPRPNAGRETRHVEVQRPGTPGLPGSAISNRASLSGPRRVGETHSWGMSVRRFGGRTPQRGLPDGRAASTRARSRAAV